MVVSRAVELRLVKHSFHSHQQEDWEKKAHTHEPPVWMKAKKIIRVICEKKTLFHILLILFYDCRKKNYWELLVVAVAVITNWNARSLAKWALAKIRYDIYSRGKFRISFVWLLVSAFSRVIHIQWCILYRSRFLACAAFYIFAKGKNQHWEWKTL